MTAVIFLHFLERRGCKRKMQPRFPEFSIFGRKYANLTHFGKIWKDQSQGRRI
jgi:hypothetical protein